MFELTNGCAPFFATNQSRRTRKILKGYDFVDVPPHFSRSLKDLIAQLLENNPAKRLGRTQAGIQSIKKHIFFAGFDWQGELCICILPKNIARLLIYILSESDLQGCLSTKSWLRLNLQCQMISSKMSLVNHYILFINAELINTSFLKEQLASLILTRISSRQTHQFLTLIGGRTWKK